MGFYLYAQRPPEWRPVRLRHALDGEHFLRVDGPTTGDKTGFEVRDFAQTFKMDAEGGAAERVGVFSIGASGGFRRRGGDGVFGDGEMRFGHWCSVREIA